MFEAADTRQAPWRLIRFDDKRRARLNAISHILENDPLQEDRARKGQAVEAIRKAATTIRPACVG